MENKKLFTGEGPYDVRQYINGKFVEATSNSFWDDINPATEEVLCKVQEASVEDIDLAVASARTAFLAFSRTGGGYRRDLLLRLAELVELHADEFALLDSYDTGKAFSTVREIDVKLAIETLRYYAGWADKVSGKFLPIQGLDPSSCEKYLCFTKHEPVGTVAQLIPWNVSLLMITWKIGPAIATGCTLVMKSSEKNPLTSLAFAKLVHEAGFPPGVINFIVGFGATVGDYLTRHPGIDKIAFTGSNLTGKKILIAAAESGMKRVSLELGGKSPLIVCADADIDRAIEVAHLGLFFHEGQVCIASSRIYVEAPIYELFVKKAVERAKRIVLASPQSPSCTQGPQVDSIQYKKILNYIDIGKKEGATLLTGGDPVKGSGFYINPTVFADVEDHMKIAQEEIFGPVMSILKFTNLEEAVARANNTPYGLAAGICTKDFPKAMSIMHQLKVGTVFINCYDVFDSAAPFGGYKQSGLGREMGEYGLQLYQEVKTVIANMETQ